MTWTYDPSDIENSQKDQVRLLCGDTDSTEQFLQDEEIEYLIKLHGSTLSAAAAACEAIAAKLARQADQKTGKIATWLSKRVDKYLEVAESLKKQAQIISAIPYVGGISVSDKEDRDAETDRVQPAFVVDMDDNTI